MLTPIPYAVTVDTEEEWDWSSGYPTGPTHIENIRRLPEFQDAIEQHGAAVTYYVNHAVMAHSESREIILELSRRPRVEIGMHIHPWNTPPVQPVADVPVRESFLHNLPPDLALAKLSTLDALFREHGLAPVTFRGGRYSTSPLIQNWLREHGFIADASILPFTRWTDDGAPDFAERDPYPVRLPGSPTLWEIPLSLAFTRRPFRFWHRVLSAAEKAPLRYFRLVRLLQMGHVVRKSWLNFENPLGEGMLQLVQALRAAGVPYLCFSLHSSSLLPGWSPYCPSPEAVRALFDRMSGTLKVLAANSAYEPATIAEITRRLEAGK
jgi:hypothetical protein